MQVERLKQHREWHKWDSMCSEACHLQQTCTPFTSDHLTHRPTRRPNNFNTLSLHRTSEFYLWPLTAWHLLQLRQLLMGHLHLHLIVACFCFMFKSGHRLQGLFKLTLTNHDAILYCRLLVATLPNTLERRLFLLASWQYHTMTTVLRLAPATICPSMWRHYCAKTFRRMITQTTLIVPYDSR